MAEVLRRTWPKAYCASWLARNLDHKSSARGSAGIFGKEVCESCQFSSTRDLPEDYRNRLNANARRSCSLSTAAGCFACACNRNQFFKCPTVVRLPTSTTYPFLFQRVTVQRLTRIARASSFVLTGRSSENSGKQNQQNNMPILDYTTKVSVPKTVAN
jgi:hypothetical protein